MRLGLWLAGLALALLLVALVSGWARLVPASLAALGGAYALYLVVDDVPLDATAPVFAAGLFLSAELGYWSLEERERIHAEAGEALRRVGVVAGLALAAIFVAAAPLALAGGVRATGLAADVVGAGAAVAILVLVLLLARRAS